MKEINIDCFGYSVAADWYQGKRSDQILLVLIGWPSSRQRYVDLVSSIVNKTGACALVLEFSGLGESKFDPDSTRPAQHFLEVINVFDQLRSKHPKARISVMGSSYGGFLATQLTKYRKFDNLILRVPAIYRPEDFYTLNGEINSDEGWAIKDSYRKDETALSKHPLLSRASSYKGNTLVVVHELDEAIPKQVTDAYIKTFKSDTYLAKGFSHSFNPELPERDILAYKSAISDWLNDHFGQ